LTVVDDTYNANPDSVRAAIDVLADAARPAPAGAGRHGRGGRPGPAVSRRGRRHARARGIETLLTLGELAQGMGGRHFDGIDALNAAVRAELPAAASVLVKGSRFMKMERGDRGHHRHGAIHTTRGDPSCC
jgi:UDP-N-acetylmuramoyl-tripeptide--D-alanyl-D-alanine ligase